MIKVKRTVAEIELVYENGDKKSLATREVLRLFNDNIVKHLEEGTEDKIPSFEEFVGGTR